MLSLIVKENEIQSGDETEDESDSSQGRDQNQASESELGEKRENEKGHRGFDDDAKSSD